MSAGRVQDDDVAPEVGNPAGGLVGWTCESCGDTFTKHTTDEPVCPSCGGRVARVAAEPFL